MWHFVHGHPFVAMMLLFVLFALTYKLIDYVGMRMYRVYTFLDRVVERMYVNRQHKKEARISPYSQDYKEGIWY